MYASNGQISQRQIFRLFLFELIGLETLILPPYLSQLTGIGGIFCILVGGILSYVFLRYMGFWLNKSKEDLATTLEKNRHSMIGMLCIILWWLQSVLTTGFAAFVFANLMEHSLIREVSFELVLLVIVVVGFFCVMGGIENRARIFEVLFWFILIPYVSMLLFSIRNVKGIYLNSFEGATVVTMLKGVFLVFLFFTPLFYILFLNPLVKNQEHVKRTIKNLSWALVLALGILLCSYVILLGNFGRIALGGLKYPIITLMSTVQFKGNFFHRMDALMISVWFFTIYAFLTLHFDYGIILWRKLIRKEGKWSLYWNGVVVYMVAYFMKHVDSFVAIFLKYYSYVVVPFMVIGPLLLLWNSKKKNRQVAMLLVSFIIVGTGCASTELEDRCFPMIVMVDYDEHTKEFLFYEGFVNTKNQEEKIPVQRGNDFVQCKREFESNLSKKVDYNHLKIFVLGKNLLNQQKEYDAMLDFIIKEERFPRNTLVCETSSIEKLLELEEHLSEDLGNYLEQYLRKHEEKKDRLLTLGTVLEEKVNKEMLLFIPYIDAKESYVEWMGYMSLEKNGKLVE